LTSRKRSPKVTTNEVEERILARITQLCEEPIDAEYYLKPVRIGVAEECYRFLIALKLSEAPSLFRTAKGKLRAEWNTVYSIQSITFRGGTKEASTYALHFPLD
jgi:hypothetical protein